MHATRHLIIGSVLLAIGATACSGSGSGSGSSATNAIPTLVTALPPKASVTIRPRIVEVTSTLADAATPVLGMPEGPNSVGVVDLPMPNSVAFYPAKVNTGAGQHTYLDSKLLGGLGVPIELFSKLTTTSRVGATPLPAASPRPVVVLAPGFGSMVALSTALAEHLASHGYVVVAVQTDMAAEAAAIMPNEARGAARTAQMVAAIDLVGSPGFARLVGPVDQHRIAVGGHSYAGSIAFNLSLHDQRVAAVFDLDGRLFGDAAATPTEVPSLVVTSTGSGEASDRQLQEMVRRGAKTVAVGLRDSQHFDLTDAAAIGGMLRNAGIPFELGTIGAVATSDTSAIVQRFLDVSLDNKAHVPSPATLLAGLPSTTDRPFANPA